ncbi:MAG TPA: GNAT family N-acetyltransferase [Anaerolineae bacterium]|jgi:GNAT superfamily N-acetyltransferase
MHIEEIRDIEELAYNAWPASVVQLVDGWRLRFHHGVTARANSVWPNECHGAMDLPARMQVVDDFYLEHGQRPIFQMCPAALPEALGSELARRGYVATRRTATQTAPIDDVINRTHRAIRGKAIDVTTGSLDDAWFNTYAEGESMNTHARSMRHDILLRVSPHACFAFARIDGQPAGVGMGVVERGWTGVFCMETLAPFRQRGVATAILRTLANWGTEHDAAQMYLQVMLSNPAALAAYARAGFTTQYTYSHCEAPANQTR